jgi:hypothetical protein
MSEGRFVGRNSGCNHVLHSWAEVGGECSGCGALLCARCAQRGCDHCGRPFCMRCLRRTRVEDAYALLCASCRSRWRGHRIASAGARGAGAVMRVLWSPVASFLYHYGDIDLRPGKRGRT